MYLKALIPVTMLLAQSAMAAPVADPGKDTPLLGAVVT